MTTELYKVDPYRTEFAAQIVAVGPNYVVLDQTCFFPLSHAQPSDTGLVGPSAICEVIRVGDELRHIMREQHEAVVHTCGDVVACQVNRQRRYRLMRLHTAQHLLQLALRTTHGVVAPMQCLVTLRRAIVHVLSRDVDCGVRVEVLQAFVDDAISSGLVAVHEPDHSLEHQRYWHIDGLAMLPCDGTHVRTTDEVGDVIVGLSNEVDDSIAVYAELTAN